MADHRTELPIGAIAAALLTTVATQVFYVLVVSAAAPDTPLRPATWLVELVAFLAIAVVAITLIARDPVRVKVWSLVTLSGLFNALQVSIGLSMFGPALEARDASPQLFATVLAGAFFLYFVAKALLGAAAVTFALGARRAATGWRRALTYATGLSGVAAVATAGLAMMDSKTWMYAAGAAGTGLAALFAIALLAARRD